MVCNFERSDLYVICVLSGSISGGTGDADLYTRWDRDVNIKERSVNKVRMRLATRSVMRSKFLNESI